ncbi:MAG: tetratricopeptide repeat protein, partial [Anaerolineales bacterium]|nr:tetratricopeptide repeat protein [Anaerolineales bacterium]
MSKVALRVYNHEIESLIEQGQVDEAIAHCQHILKTYPKHLETYRLLGNAYLEAQRHNDAADIFQRVLTSVPDDFVSHLGMSIINDEHKNLDQAIWHMERAYESNPSNGGVQAELRRLYGRRDGLEPPKIQMTRGALAKMYLRGAQYAQAIQEIKTVLNEDKDRLDLKVLLAQALFRSGKKVEATEICTEILQVSPYCFDVNRILVEILPGTSLAANVDTYKKRLQQLDPYIAFVTGSTFDVSSVQDMAVGLERLEWDERLANRAEAGWQVESESVSSPESESEVEIPDWMKTSGWGPSSGEAQEGPLDFDEPSVSAEELAAGELAAAEIPDWLKAMAPPGSGQADSAEGQPDADSESADLDWLAGINAASGAALTETGVEFAQPQQPAAPQAEPPADNADWLAGLGQSAAETQQLQPEPAAADDVPDWLAGLGAETEQPAAPQAETSAADNADWLAGLGAQAQESAAETQQPQPEPAAADDVPSWLAGLGAETEQPAAPQAETSAADNADWLAGLGAETEQPAELEQPQPEPAAADDVPDWLAGLGAETEQSAAPQAEPAADNADWLAGLGAQAQESAAETQQPQPEPAAADDVPDWLAGLGAETEQPAAPQAETSAADNADWLAGLGAQAQESAAETQQLQPEPAAADDVPDWLAGVGAETDQPAAPHAESDQPGAPV